MSDSDYTVMKLEERIRELEAEVIASAEETAHERERADQFAEQAAARDQRGVDMQELMRINNEQKERAEKAEAELDATRDLERDLENVIAERAAIRAETIEECARLVDHYPSLTRITKEIRALVQTGLANQAFEEMERKK